MPRTSGPSCDAWLVAWFAASFVGAGAEETMGDIVPCRGHGPTGAGDPWCDRAMTHSGDDEVTAGTTVAAAVRVVAWLGATAARLPGFGRVVPPLSGARLPDDLRVLLAWEELARADRRVARWLARLWPTVRDMLAVRLPEEAEAADRVVGAVPDLASPDLASADLVSPDSTDPTLVDLLGPDAVAPQSPRGLRRDDMPAELVVAEAVLRGLWLLVAPAAVSSPEAARAAWEEASASGDAP